MDAEQTWRSLLWSVTALAETLGRPSAGDEDELEAALPWQDASTDVATYRRWFASQLETRSLRPRRPSPEPPVTFSVIVPVHRPELWYVERCLDSVRAQHYEHWELCICDDGSADPALTERLERLAAADPRIKLTANPTPTGISRASNAAAAMATNEFLAFVDHDDELDPDALALVAEAIARVPDADVVYTDEDRLDREGLPCFPHFKPEWSPELLASFPYLGHLLVVRRSLFEAVGGLRPHTDGSQDYDLMLRTTELARAVVHVPVVLYHWRMIPGSSAGDPQARPWAHEASRRALAEALERRGEDADIAPGPFPGAYRVRRRVKGNPSVSVIVPFRDHPWLLRSCVDALGIDAGHDRFEVVIVDNDSEEPETHALIDLLIQRPNVRLVRAPGPFNWSVVNNVAASTCDTDVLLFMNDDVRAQGRGWMSAMLGHALRPEVGVVGARLVFPDGSVQHAGVIVGMGVLAAHLMHHLPADQTGYMAWPSMTREYSAVTGATMMCRRQVFEELGGFDEEYEVAFNDVDFCLRAREAGYRVVYTPDAELVHDESKTRGLSGYGPDHRRFLQRWSQILRDGDPFFSPNLSRLELRCVVRPLDEDDRWEEICGLRSLSNA